MPAHLRLALGGLVLALVLAVLGVSVPPPALADDPARIDSPLAESNVSGAIEIRGRAQTTDPSRFSFYRLYYGAGRAPSVLRPIGNSSDQPVESGVLGRWDTSTLLVGEYTIQLSVYDKSGATTTVSVVVNVQPAPTPTPLLNQPPLVLQPGQTPEPSDENTGPTPTPYPEIAPLVPVIPQFEDPQPNQGPAIQQVQPNTGQPGFQPIQIDTGQPSTRPDLTQPQQTDPVGPRQFDPGPSNSAPQFQPINPVNAPGAPIVAPYETPLPPPPPTSTLIGL